ncbi:hypothetical protein CV102_14120 [Natronococcus pandeyae]|uniref:DUF1616 domain-containing protein n=1 Tax=Natronococcus pandeyae TaxID=2055836 RepID=A0A8J8Q2R8_9EURY|nr:DUF1616 domain-containing protein [Natronococcus pandeyae]TYL37864.1 hypothetical protein CV102_14120 [Natronococcus pandeyae]
MDDRRSLRLLLPRPLRRLPADLTAMLAVTTLVNVAVFAPLLRETPLRVPLGLAFALFVPGYVFIAALFPEAGESPTAEQSTDESDANGVFADTPFRSGIDGIERVALAFGLSIAIVPLIGLLLNFTPWGIRLTPIMVSLTAFTVVATAVAAHRRWELPADERFHVPYREWYGAGRAELFEPETRLDGALNVLLVCSIVLAVGVVGFAVVSPPQGEQFSAIYILTEDDDGELVADGYPTEFTQGESAEIVLGVDNHEHETTDYTVVVLEQETETVVNESATGPPGGENETTENETTVNETVVTDQQELDRFETTLAHNESWHHTHDLEPTMVGEDIRIVWLLYPDGEVPEEPSIDDTEYHVHLWVDVDEGGG